MPHHLSLIALLLAVFTTAGCAIRTPAAPERAAMEPATFDESIWPSRWTADLPAIAERLPQTLHIYIPQFEKREDGDWELVERSRTMPMQHFTAREPHGVGIVQTSVRTSGHESLPEGIELQTLLAILRERQENEYAKDRPARTIQLRFLSWRDEPREELLDSDDFRDWMSYSAGLLFIPTERQPHSLAIVTGGGSEYDWEVRWRLLERGWAILHLGMSAAIDHRPTVEFELNPSAEALDDAAAEIAATIDHYIADAAYSMEAFLSYAREHEPALRDLPIVLIGFSRGAFAVPAMAARLPERPAAAVLVTGGANLLDVALRTALRDQQWLRVSAADANGKPRRLSRSERAALLDAYRSQANLDPYHTAAALHGIPTLLIHGTFDRIVPASSGNLLYERLARPERWSYPLGHSGVFWLLPGQAERIAEWAEAAADAGTG